MDHGPNPKCIGFSNNQSLSNKNSTNLWCTRLHLHQIKFLWSLIREMVYDLKQVTVLSGQILNQSVLTDKCCTVKVINGYTHWSTHDKRVDVDSDWSESFIVYGRCCDLRAWTTELTYFRIQMDYLGCRVDCEWS